jgi:uncharacterized membrane protein YcaP (DUF421 family)
MFGEELKILFDELKVMPEIVLRSFFSVVILFALTKFMGKRQISQLTFFDYCIGISIGSIAAQMAGDDEASYIHAIIAMAVYAIVSVLSSYITQKSLPARQIITGIPVMLMEKGHILYKNMKKSRLDINDFLEECRCLGYFDLNDIEYAILEPNGKVSILQKAHKKPATVDDLKIVTTPVGMTINLIIDGTIIEENLKIEKKDKTWLLSQLKQNNIDQLSDVLLATYSVDGVFTVYKKGEPQINNTKI